MCCFLAWLLPFELFGILSPSSSYANAGTALRIIRSTQTLSPRQGEQPNESIFFNYLFYLSSVLFRHNFHLSRSSYATSCHSFWQNIFSFSLLQTSLTPMTLFQLHQIFSVFAVPSRRWSSPFGYSSHTHITYINISPTPVIGLVRNNFDVMSIVEKCFTEPHFTGVSQQLTEAQHWKLIVLQLVNEFPTFYGTKLFSALFTKAPNCPYPETRIQYNSSSS